MTNTPSNQTATPHEQVEAILRRYGVPENDIEACRADLAPHTPTGTTHDEFGVERRWGIEWGGSVGISHNYPYTADSVFGLADGNPVYRRTRTTHRDQLSEPERIYPPNQSPS